MQGLAFDIAHLLAGGLVLVSFMMIYQDRLPALINMFALQAILLSASVAWQANIQQEPYLYPLPGTKHDHPAVPPWGSAGRDQGSRSVAHSRKLCRQHSTWAGPSVG